MRVALCQMRSGEDVEENVALAARLLGEAADGNADLAALPEVFTYLGSSVGRAAAAEPVPGPTTARLAEIARLRRMWVLGGSVIELDGDHRYATSVLIDRDGELVATYRKIHLFDVDLPGQPPFRESATFAPGDQLVTHETDVGRIGLSICYDLRFPELYRGLMVMEPRCCSCRRSSSTRRARTTGKCSCVPGRSRTSASWSRPGSGDSSATRRRGGVPSATRWPWTRGGACWFGAPEEGDGVWFADLDMTELRRVRQVLPALQHRRLGLTC